MNQKIDILIVKPGEAPCRASIENTFEAAEEMLGGVAQIGCFLPQKVLLLSRQDGESLRPNRLMPRRKDIINGPFLLCGVSEKGSDFVSLTSGQRKEFQDIFARPGEFMTVGGTVYADPDDVADAVYRLWDTLGDGETVTLTKWGRRTGSAGLQEGKRAAGAP